MAAHSVGKLVVSMDASWVALKAGVTVVCWVAWTAASKVAHWVALRAV